MLAKDGLALAKNFNKIALEGIESVNYAWITFLHLGSTQFDTLASIILLLEKEQYKDCFALLRSVFESYFFLQLMMFGKRFRESRRFKIIPQADKEPRVARDETLEKWKNDKRAGDPRYTKVVNLEKEDEDIIIVTIEDEGLYQENDRDKKGPIITRYYFAFQEYDPETRFVAKLPSVSAGDPYPNITDEQWCQQKIIYHQYFYVSNLVRNLKMNKILNEEQIDRFEVHYNFLSTFIHPTKPGTIRINDTTYQHPYTPEVMRIVRHRLVLVYVCKLQAMLLKSLILYFREINPKTDFQKFEALVERLEKATADFWFIYDEPTEFDKKQSEYIKRTATTLGYTIPDNITFYYRDPSQRLADYMISQEKIRP
jgi:hypothetical protein